MTMTADTHHDAGTYAPPAPPPKRRRASRTSPQLLVALLAGLLAMGGFLVATNGATGEPVAVAARDLAAGEPVSAGDFRLLALDVPAELSGLVLRPSDVNSTVSRVTTHALVAGALVQRSDLAESSAPAQQRAISIPIDPTRAVNGALRAGDLVDVIDASGAEAVYVLTGARVLATADAGGGRLGGSAQDYSLTVAVDAGGALRVAAAITTDKLSVVRSTGAPAVTVSPPATAVRR